MFPQPQAQTDNSSAVDELLKKRALDASIRGNYQYPQDPNSLRSHMLVPAGQTQPGMVPPNQDVNQGVEIKPQMSLVDKAAHFVKKLVDPSTPLDPSMGMMEAATPVAGMVLSPKNAATVKQTLKEALQANPGMNKTQQALEFMKALHPKWTGQAPIDVVPPRGDIPGMVDLGSYDIFSKTAKIMHHPEERVSTQSNVGTIAHEMAHARQNKKDPIGLTTAYIPPQHDVDKYLGQYWETDARKYQHAGEKAFDKFKGMIRTPPNQLDLQSPITAEHINESILPGVNKILESTSPEGRPPLAAAYNKMLTRAAKTAAGKDRFYDHPVSLEDVLRHFSPGDRKPMYEGLQKLGYHGLTNPTGMTRVPYDWRSFADLILDK